MGVFDSAFKLVHGAVNAVGDVVSAGHHIVTLDLHGLVTDAQKLVGDVGDFLKGTAGLGLGLTHVAAKYAGHVIPKALNSPPLEAAQLLIEGMKATTGSGEPIDGAEFQKGGKLFEEATEILIDAKPLEDRWNGAASKAYQEANNDHMHGVSGMSVSDMGIGKILNDEATQVSDTRKNLDDWSQYLYDFGLATSVVAMAGAPEVKLALDAAAATAGIAATGVAMDILVFNALQNGRQLLNEIDGYREAAKQVIPTDSACAPFGEDNKDHDQLPTRSKEEEGYKPPAPEKPFEYGPPATPYGSPSSAPSSAPTPGHVPAPAPTPSTGPMIPSPAAPTASAPAAGITSAPAASAAAGPLAPATSGSAPAQSVPAAASPAPAASPGPTVSTAAPSSASAGPAATAPAATRAPVASGLAPSPTAATSATPAAQAQPGPKMGQALNGSGRAPVDFAAEPDLTAAQLDVAATR